MPDVLFSIDQSKSLYDQAVPPHNRWHPDVPPVATVRPGTEFRLGSREWFDGTVHNDDSADDIRDLDLSMVHALRGPIAVEGAQPGDLLVVDILEIGPVPEEIGPVAGQGWGYTGIFAKANGGGFLTDHFPDAYKAVWDFHGQVATSRHLPGVRFTGITHPGIIGTAPSHERTSRTSPVVLGSSCRSTSRVASCRPGICTSARATARSPYAAPSRCRPTGRSAPTAELRSLWLTRSGTR